MYRPDFIERNGAWILSLTALCFTCFGTLLAYMLKSRCKTIRCFGIYCDRDVLTVEDIRKLEANSSLQERGPTVAAASFD